MRLRLDLGYDGSDFHGWARQPGLRTVQGELEDALDTVLRTEGSSLTVAGRTDTGVHARSQVAHLDLDPELLVQAATHREAGEAALLRRLNGKLPDDVRVHRVTSAPAGFHARFSALWRRYAYRIVDEPAAMDPLLRGQVLAWGRPLDVDAMNQASTQLLGEQDFGAFCRRRSGATTVRTLLDLQWRRCEDGTLVATVRADAFCHNMVRSLVGCLVAVGEGRRPPAWAGEVLVAGMRDPAVRVMRARGLTLEEVAYPDPSGMAARAAQSRALRTLTLPSP